MKMLKRKIAKQIEEHLTSPAGKILLVDGARQVGKTYIVRWILRNSCTQMA